MGCGCCENQKACACREEETVRDSEIIELRGEVRTLSRTVGRLASLVKIEEPHRERKAVRNKEEIEERKREQREADGDRDSRGRRR